MRKALLDGFIQRYNLAGAAESVLITSEKNALSTQFITDDKNVLGNVAVRNVEIEDGEYPVFDTTQLRQLLGVLDDDISVRAAVAGKNIELSDDSTKVTYVLADKTNIPASSGLKKLPPFEIQLVIDQKFVSTFVRSSGALPDVESFTVFATNDAVEIVLGHQENINTNKVTMHPTCTRTKVCEPISFSSRYLRAIFMANKDGSEGVMKISPDGLIHVNYESDDFSANYYIAKLDRKD